METEFVEKELGDTEVLQWRGLFLFLKLRGGNELKIEFLNKAHT